jgi:hypothetical protein
MTQKMNGKTLYVTTFTVSGDGRTLTEAGAAAGTSESIKLVYDRQ